MTSHMLMQGQLHCSEGVVIEAAVRGQIVAVLSQHMQAVHRAVRQEARRLEAKANAKANAKRAKKRAKAARTRPAPSCMLRSGVDGVYRGGIFYLFKNPPGTCNNVVILETNLAELT